MQHHPITDDPSERPPLDHGDWLIALAPYRGNRGPALTPSFTSWFWKAKSTSNQTRLKKPLKLLIARHGFVSVHRVSLGKLTWKKKKA